MSLSKISVVDSLSEIDLQGIGDVTEEDLQENYWLFDYNAVIPGHSY